MTDISANFENLKIRVNDAAERVGRDFEEIQIVAITKTHPPGVVREAYTLGMRDFGENRVLEALEKQSHLQDLTDIRWHMVGHIQSRKASEVPGHFQIVHSIDRMKIARYLDKYAQQKGMKLPVFLECNVSGEQSKYGWELSDRGVWEGVAKELRNLFDMGNLEVRGLMTMAPWVQDDDIIRATFKQLRTLRDFLQDELDVSLPELSMGMTDDFEIAVEEGATMLRIGRAIFGPRQTTPQIG
jgi:pyridoxal phosphate enzyme (YggS family)